MICQQVTLSGDAEWPKVADAVIEAAPAGGEQMQMGVVLPIAPMRVEHGDRAPLERLHALWGAVPR